MTLDQIHYFAYGSNLTPSRLIARVGPCRNLGRAYLPDYRLAFRKNGSDGSAKCDLIQVPDQELRAEGVVYQLRASARPVLDRFEGVGLGYRVETVDVQLAGNYTKIDCFVYLAIPPFLNDDVQPYSWYRDFVLNGGRRHGFSQQWQSFVDSHPVQVDADIERLRTNASILAADENQALQLYEEGAAT